MHIIVHVESVCRMNSIKSTTHRCYYSWFVSIENPGFSIYYLNWNEHIWNRTILGSCWNVSNNSGVGHGSPKALVFFNPPRSGDLCKTRWFSLGHIQRHFSVYPLFVWKLTRIKASNYQRQIPVSPEPGLAPAAIFIPFGVNIPEASGGTGRPSNGHGARGATNY